MGDDICEISSPNSRACACKARKRFAHCRKNHPQHTFFGVLGFEMGLFGSQMGAGVVVNPKRVDYCTQLVGG